MGPEETIPVEVAYARPDRQLIVQVDVPANVTVEEAIRASGILNEFPEIDLSRNRVGIFSRITRLDAHLRPRDRIEIYRPLSADPKSARRRRAAA